MAMGRRRASQRDLFVGTADLARGPGHPFYAKLNELLKRAGFDEFVERECAGYYAERMGRPSLAPGVYFRLLLIGYFEGLDSERGIAWRVADSLTLREFLGYGVTEATPDHSTISRNRRRIAAESHQRAFSWVLGMLARQGLVKGKTLGVDATTLEANAALRSIVRRDTGEEYQEFLEGLAKESGIETPSREDLAKLDKGRKNKASNEDWVHPNDPDAKITKMKDGRTHLAHKAEHAVDMETGAVLGVTVQPANRGDTQSLQETLEETAANLEGLIEDPASDAQLSKALFSELVADKGYHSGGVLQSCEKQTIRSYLSEPRRGRRRWRGRPAERDATYANRRRIRGERGRRLLRQRGEKIERGFAHCYETGGLRRMHLRGHPNILKRLLVHVAGHNLGLLMRKVCGYGTPRALQGLAFALHRAAVVLRIASWVLLRRLTAYIKKSPSPHGHHADIHMIK
jgi:transposase